MASNKQDLDNERLDDDIENGQKKLGTRWRLR